MIKNKNTYLDYTDLSTQKRVADLRKMKIFATLLFCSMGVLFIISHIFAKSFPYWGYAKAFAEAGMIGALADWFAVVALFKRPLGFPYHTSIIPEKSLISIGTALSSDESSKNKINDLNNNFLAKNISKWTDEITDLISNTARKWDKNEMIRKHEIQGVVICDISE